MKTRKSWLEKLAASKDLPKTLVIPAPREVDEIMRRVPKGKVMTIREIRDSLAQKHGTTTACPMTTGIFAWIAAQAAVEAADDGGRKTTPYWRTLKAEGEINAKYPGGIPLQKKLLEAEGHTVVKRRNSYFVANHQQSLFRGRGVPDRGRAHPIQIYDRRKTKSHANSR